MQICSKLEIILTFSRKCLFTRIFTLPNFTLHPAWWDSESQHGGTQSSVSIPRPRVTRWYPAIHLRTNACKSEQTQNMMTIALICFRYSWCLDVQLDFQFGIVFSWFLFFHSAKVINPLNTKPLQTTLHTISLIKKITAQTHNVRAQLLQYHKQQPQPFTSVQMTIIAILEKWQLAFVYVITPPVRHRGRSQDWMSGMW